MKRRLKLRKWDFSICRKKHNQIRKACKSEYWCEQDYKANATSNQVHK